MRVVYGKKFPRPETSVAQAMLLIAAVCLIALIGVAFQKTFGSYVIAAAILAAVYIFVRLAFQLAKLSILLLRAAIAWRKSPAQDQRS